MKNFTRYTLLLVIIITVHIASIKAQNIPLPKQITTLTLRDGLPHNAVSAMMLDSKGYLWIGTYDGLARYNSHNITNINFEEEVEYTLLRQRIRSLAQDCQGDIWIGSDVGVLKMSQSHAKTKELALPQTENIRNNFAITKLLFILDKELMYAIAEGYGLLIYNLEGDLLESVKMPQNTNITDAIIDPYQRLILTTNQGLFVYDQTVSKEFMPVEGTPHKELTTLLYYNKYRVLLATQNALYNGELRYDTQKHSYHYTTSNDPRMPKGRFYTIHLDSSGSLWMGTLFDGVKYIHNFTKGRRHLRTILDNERISLFLPQGDDQMWVGTFDHGVNKYSKTNEVFINIGEYLERHDLQMSRIATWDSTTLMINTMHNRSHLYNATKREITPTPKNSSLLDSEGERSLLRCSDGTTWLFTKEGYWLRLDPSGNTSKIKSDITKEVATRITTTTVEDQNGSIWQGFDDNLCRITLDENGNPCRVEWLSDHKIFENRETPKIRVIYPDPKFENIIWAGSTTYGLLKIAMGDSLKESSIEVFNNTPHNKESLPSNFVSSILRHSDGELWVGTEYGGVCRVLTDGSSRFERLTTSDGLSNNVVKSMVEDMDGNLWIATNYGLNRLNIEDKQIFVYHESDGLPFEQFWYNALLLDNGELIFSGVDGILQFNPSDLSKEKTLPNLEFSELQLLNRVIKPLEEVDGEVILEGALTDQSRIKLGYNENMLRIGVDVIHQTSMNNSHIRYQLLPVSQEWLNIPSSVGAITLNGLDAGEYTLNVVAIDALGQKTETKTIYIDIASHPLKSTQAILIYIVLGVILIYIIIASILHVSNLNHNLALERMKKRNAEQLNEEKQRYFINISHELKTPLSLILAPTNALAQRFRFDVDITSKVDLILRQSKRMLHLIDSTHKMNLDDMNILQPQLQPFNFDSFMARLINDFRFVAEQEGKRLEVDGCQVYVSGDKALLEMAICNLLNNAFKYTRSEDKISISYRIVDRSLILRVTDTGVGISEEDLPRIFERYFRGSDAMKRRLGTGIGLSFTKRLIELHGGRIEAYSTLGVGASFTVTLPILFDIIGCEEEQSAEYLKGLDDAEYSDRSDSIIITTDQCDELAPTIAENIQGSTIYVVEDNASMRGIIVDALEPHFKVKTFESAESCLEQMSQTWPQIVISDVVMGAMSGYELCQKIKGSLTTSHIPVILLTGLSSVDDKIKGLEAGADAYIYKPFYIKHLLTRVEHLLRGREELRRRFEAGIPFDLSEKSSMTRLDNNFIDSLYRLFDENLENETIDMDYIASELSLSRATLYQKIKALMGSTPYELLKSYRLTRAADLLRQGGDTNVNEVSVMTGFKNRAHFSRVFKERYGVSPSKYIKRTEDNEA